MFVPQENLQRICGAYLACLAKFREQVPANHYNSAKEELDKAFLSCNVSLIINIEYCVTNTRLHLHLSVTHDIRFRFNLRHADNDLVNLMSESVPPADTDRVQIFKSQMAKFVQKARP